jgi:hypothetical protein
MICDDAASTPKLHFQPETLMLLSGQKMWRKLVENSTRRGNRRRKNVEQCCAAEVLEDRCLLSGDGYFGPGILGDGSFGPGVPGDGSFGPGMMSQTVGYYDMTFGQGDPNQVAPILTAGHTPVQLFDLTAADLAGIDVLDVQNPSNGIYGAEYLSNLADIEAAVSAGMTLVIHDRFVDFAESILPGSAGFNIVRDFADAANIDVRDNTTLVTNGPGGIVDNLTLDGGNSSSHGFAFDASLPAGAALILTTGDPTHIVTFAYNHGSGTVIYSSIPLDFYLGGGSGFDQIYAPNVLAYAATNPLGGLKVTSTDPADGSVVVGATPTQYIVNVSSPLAAGTVDAGDFQVNGIVADNVSYTPGDTSLTFTFNNDPVMTQGVQTMHVDAGAFNSVTGGGVDEFNGTFRWDAVLMQVTSTDPLDGSDILLTAPTLDLNFNEAYDFASAQPGDFTLNQGSVSAVSQVDADTLRLTLGGLINKGTLTVDMAAGAMTDVYGNPGAAFSGSYFLPFQVTDTSIAGARQRGPTTQITVNFNSNVLLTSLDASDLTIDGTPATGFTVVDPDTVIFDLPALTESIHNVQITGIEDVQNALLVPFNLTFYEDLTAPRVIDSSVQHNSTISISGSTQDVTETITFSEPMNTSGLDNSNFSLHGAFLNVNYTPASASYDATGTILTLNYIDLPEDYYSLTLISGDGRFEDAAQPNGWNLDGEFNGTFPSGDGVEGGDFVLNFSLDVGTAAFPTPLTPEAPLGSLIYGSSVTGIISPGSDTDSFTILLDAGQTISVVASPDSGLQPTIELTNSANADVETAAAAANGQDALLQAVATVAGTYTITVGGDGTSGQFTLQVTLNAALESESHDGPSNDLLATAQDINGSFIDLMKGADRGAVVGSLDGSADFYSFSLSAGESATVALKVPGTPMPFGDRTDYSVGSYPYAIAYGDLNGDGYADMVTANYYGGNATLRLNNGDGSFGAASTVVNIPYASDAVVDDVNSDGKLDIVLSSRYGDPFNGSVTVLPGNGDGTFNAPIRSYLGYNTPGIALADFNGDGILDVAQTRNGNASIAIGFGNNSGRFTFAGAYYAGAYPWRVVAADMNGDGAPDLVTANLVYGINDVNILLNNGNGSFGSAVGYFNNRTNDYTYGLAVGDVNGDGAPDVVTTKWYGGSVSVRLNRGAGTLDAATAYSTGGTYVRSVTMGDVDGDGQLDLAVANHFPFRSSASVLHGNGNGSFGSPDVYSFATYAAPVDVALVDLNNDGLADLSSLNFIDSNVSVWLTLSLQLLDPNDVVVAATGISDASNVDRLIYNYTATSTGTYRIRIPGNFATGNYSLVVTRNAVFDREANGTSATAQNFDGVVGSLGYVSGSDEDWYSVTLTAGTVYAFPTITPGDGPGEFVNTLDPHIELYDSSGTMLILSGTTQGDGRNEQITFTPANSGLYLIRVTAEGGTSGEYFLDPAVATEGAPAAAAPAPALASEPVGAALSGSGQAASTLGIVPLFAQSTARPSAGDATRIDAFVSSSSRRLLQPAFAGPIAPNKDELLTFSLDDPAFNVPATVPAVGDSFDPAAVFADFDNLLNELLAV